MNAFPERTEEDYLPISGLQHLMFCERQGALIHVEHVFLDNVLTVQGQQLHQRVDKPGVHTQRGVRVARGLRVVSHRLALVGVADAVEFLPSASGERPYPVEYKRGAGASQACDEIQLCAQAMALEEMLGVNVLLGALYYGAAGRRIEVILDSPLRLRTEAAARRFHELVDTQTVPSAVPFPGCRGCSLREVCLPERTGGGTQASTYLEGLAMEPSEPMEDV